MPPIQTPTGEAIDQLLRVTLTPQEYKQVKEIAGIRKTNASATGRWLICKALDWWDSLTDAQREVV